MENPLFEAAITRGKCQAVNLKSTLYQTNYMYLLKVNVIRTILQTSLSPGAQTQQQQKGRLHIFKAANSASWRIHLIEACDENM